MFRVKMTLKALVVGSVALLLVSSPAIAQPRGAKPSATCNQKEELARPIPLGVSGGNINDLGGGFCCTATLGSLVAKPGGKKYVLSNNHAIARTSTTDASAVAGEDVVQPGLADSSCIPDSSNGVADLSAWVPISFAAGTSNTADAAIAEIRDGAVDPKGTILNIGTLSSSSVGPSENIVGMAVQKMGRTSCRTTGKIAAVSVTLDVNYGDSGVCGAIGGGVATFADQIRIDGSRFSRGGDSGSLIVTRETCPRAAGLLFAGGPTSTFANRISNVQSALGVTMVGACLTSSGATVSSTNGGGQPVPSPMASSGALDAVAKVKARHEAHLMSIPGVVGAGVAAGDRPGRYAIEVYVVEDTAEVRAQIPPSVEGVPVRMIETGEIVAY
jgi:hypothetical protein